MNTTHKFIAEDLESQQNLPLGRVINIRDKVLNLCKPNVMGILNLTPDSFSDGNQFVEPQVALARIESMITEGADIIDIGAESTRPGAAEISVQQELDRLGPVLEKLKNLPENILISIDTSKPQVMEEVISKYNIDIINDVRALRERDNQRDGLNILAKANIPVILMHMQGKPRSMQRSPKYENVINDVFSFLQYRIEMCKKFGIKTSNIIIDPGFGFGKTWYDNASVLKYLAEFKKLNCPIAVGLSRKSMIERTNRNSIPTDKRLPGSLALAVMAVERGASIIRCHDVAATRQAVDLAYGVLEDGNCIDE